MLARVLSSSLNRVKSGFGYPKKTSGKIVTSSGLDASVVAATTITRELREESTQLKCSLKNVPWEISPAAEISDDRFKHEIQVIHPHGDNKVKNVDDIIVADNARHRGENSKSLIVRGKRVSVAGSVMQYEWRF